MENLWYLILAYAFAWFAVLAYVHIIAQRQRRLERDLHNLKQVLEQDRREDA
jgi:CcmD family protein